MIRKKLLLPLLTLVVCAGITGCGSNSNSNSGENISSSPVVESTGNAEDSVSVSGEVPADEASAEELVNAVSDQLTFGEDTMMMIPDDTMSVYFRFDEAIVADKASYISSTRFTANEVTVFKAIDSDHVDAIKAVLEERIADQQREYENYQPQEMEKINNALLYSNGNYVLLVMADDTSQVKSIFDALL